MKKFILLCAGIMLIAGLANAQTPVRRGEIDSLKAELSDAADLILLQQEDINDLKSGKTAFTLDDTSAAKLYGVLDRRYMWMPGMKRADDKLTAIQSILAAGYSRELRATGMQDSTASDLATKLALGDVPMDSLATILAYARNLAAQRLDSRFYSRDDDIEVLENRVAELDTTRLRNVELAQVTLADHLGETFSLINGLASEQDAAIRATLERNRGKRETGLRAVLANVAGLQQRADARIARLQAAGVTVK